MSIETAAGSPGIVVFGAGSIGAFIGGSLLATGADVRLIGRASMRSRIARYGLRVSDLQGHAHDVGADRVPYFESPEALAGAELVIVAAKSAATAVAADEIRRHAPPSAVVASFQNGMDNVALLRSRLPEHVVVGAMVPFNVVQLDDGRLHRGTVGELMVESHPEWSRWAAAFEAAHLPLVLRDDFVAVQWGKLLLNLNNAINALAGIPLKAELSQRAYRIVLAQLVDEALAALSAARIVPAQVGGAAPEKLPALLRLPDAQYLQIAATTVRMDPQARSSMWDDLEAGRLTEVDELNGAVVGLARRHGTAAVTNARICALVHAAEQGGDRHLSGDALLAALGLPPTG